MEQELFSDVLLMTNGTLNLQKYNLKITKVVSNDDNEIELTEAYTGNGKMVNSEFLNGLDVDAAKKLVIKKIEDEKIGKSKILYRLKIGVFLGRDIGVVDTNDLS